ncbi:MAG: S1 RNA-binding domain-containing protein, partial [Sandaracinaceae bacterium]|nr:S1 RNA-binding domain-containing protein [Sandaracinaceae bacterium]
EEERKRKLAELAPGRIVRGVVSAVRQNGLFVDIGGIEAFVPARELAHMRVQPKDAYQVGDVVEAEVKEVVLRNDANARDRHEIRLSIRSVQSDPWEAAEKVAQVGKVLAGQVSRFTNSGAFVRLEFGIEGFLPLSELSFRKVRPDEVLSIGQNMLVRVRSIDMARRRLELALPSEDAKAGDIEADREFVVGEIVEASVEHIEPQGLVVQRKGVPGRSGRAFIPSSETGKRPGADLRKEFPIGTFVRAKVIEVSGGKAKLSIRAAQEEMERAEFDAYRASRGGKAPLGTLGDLLKTKLPEIKRS